jgi:Flp pilus assembly protein TadG
MSKYQPTRLSRRMRLSLRKRRGAEFIEFAILVPIFMAMILFLFGAAALVITQIGINDSMQQFVREGAQTGGLIDCYVGAGCQSNSPPFINLQNSINDMPGGDWNNVVDPVENVNIAYGGDPNGSGGCTSNSPYVTATLHYVPTGAVYLTIMTKILQTADSGWSLTATATARCDVARN